MKFKQLIAGGTIAGALFAAASGMGVGVANADPGSPPPNPGGNHGGPPGGPGHGGPPPGGFQGQGGPGPGGPGAHGPGGPGGPTPWHGDDRRGYFHGAPWGDGPAPWGWGEPPRPVWGGPLPGPGGPWIGGPINFWGYQETPVWDPGFNQWGFWFFGVWIPL